MQFKHIKTQSLSLDAQLQWILYSEQTHGFVVGDERHAFVLPLPSLDAPVPLGPVAAEVGAYPCNLPIPRALYDEFASNPWHGFRFLNYDAY